MYNQGYRPQPGQTKSGYYDAQGNWYVPAPGQAGPGQPQRRRASQPAPRQRRPFGPSRRPLAVWMWTALPGRKPSRRCEKQSGRE